MYTVQFESTLRFVENWLYHCPLKDRLLPLAFGRQNLKHSKIIIFLIQHEIIGSTDKDTGKTDKKVPSLTELTSGKTKQKGNYTTEC